jgi:predicted RNase H-like nuclease
MNDMLSADFGSSYGIDGCKGGWVIASFNSLHSVSFEVSRSLAAPFALARERDFTLAIDIPIGLPERGARICDRQARAFLRPSRASSVFSPPTREALAAETHAEASRINRAHLGVGLTIQAFCIGRKIREVDELMSPESQQHIREVHPEVCFASVSGRPMKYHKPTAEGRSERLQVLNAAGLEISACQLIEQRVLLGRSRVALDDLVDALICLITASYIRAGRSCQLGNPNQRDSRGLLMEIVHCTPAHRAATP